MFTLTKPYLNLDQTHHISLFIIILMIPLLDSSFKIQIEQMFMSNYLSYLNLYQNSFNIISTMTSVNYLNYLNYSSEQIASINPNDFIINWMKV